MIAQPSDRFAPISLPDLLDEAELLTRFDRKYLLDRSQAAAFLAALDRRTRVLTIDKGTGFRYQSVYFDTPDLTSYRQAAHSHRRRFKIRTRSYLDSDLTFLEVKTRGDREVTVKDRLVYPHPTRGELTAPGRDHVEQTLNLHRLDGSAAQLLTPTLITHYRRLTLLPPEPGTRLTIDTDLTWVLPEGHHHFLPHSDSGRQIWQPSALSGRRWRSTDPRQPLSLPELVIVETKSGSRPSGIDRLLWRSGHRPLSLSKYGTGLAALRGELPSNKWARVLRQHFHVATDAAIRPATTGAPNCPPPNR